MDSLPPRRDGCEGWVSKLISISLLLILILITTELSNQKYILKDIDEFIFIAASNSMNWNDNEVLKYSTGTGTDTDSQ